MTTPNTQNLLQEKFDWVEVLPAELQSTASRTSKDVKAPNSCGIILMVKVANEAGTCAFTPSLRIKDPAGNYLTLWTAGAAISANGTYIYVLGQDTLTGMNGSSVTATALVAIPHTFSFILTYAGTPANDKMDTQAWIQGF